MGRGTETKLWCIKLSSNAAFLFKGGKRIPNFQNIVGAGVSQPQQHRMEFIPTQSGSYHYATLNPRHFNPFDCDGDFKNIGSSRDADSLANHICNKTYFIPVKCLVMPPKERQIRTVDDRFLKDLITSMEELPSGNHEALFVLVKGIKNKEEFNLDKVEQHEYEILGGTHVMLATKQLNEMYPDNQSFQGRVARIYIGLSDQEALWLGAMHNNTGAFRHHLTYRDEVEISRTQLFLPIQDCTGEPPQPSDSWRDMCASLPHKKKRILSEVFAMAQLSADGWKHFKTLNTMFENVQLEGQKPKATDIVNKGKPILKQWQLKPLCGLSNHDQNFLLEKVAKCEMSLEELKSAATEIKCLRPIQEAIVNIFKLTSWEDVETEFGSAVSPGSLSQFIGKDFEQTHEFQKFLERLKRRKDGDAVELTDLVNGQLGALGLIVSSKTLLDVEQISVAKLPHFQGAFLAIGQAGKHCKNAPDVIGLISRINFTKLTSFNIVLFTVVDDVRNLKDKMMEEGATYAQTGHFYVQSKPHSSLNTFVVGHWSVSKQMTSRHFSIENDGNLIIVEHVPAQCNNEEQLPVGAYAWLVKHLSREGDTVTDAGSSTGYAMVAALKKAEMQCG
ncbi:uncharacterized protein [Montipora capricornis]|uniref:uncharacterized protein n=1 Tax=Montipora capricornis TaxID=246305 RepID=UPI0035F14B45